MTMEKPQNTFSSLPSSLSFTVLPAIYTSVPLYLLHADTVFYVFKIYLILKFSAVTAQAGTSLSEGACYLNRCLYNQFNG